MTAQRRRDPRLPHEHGLEDVETVVNGETISYRKLTPADELIIAANQSELDVRRVMWGLDRDQWLLAAEELGRSHPDAAVVILSRWCDVAIACRQFDTREPDPYGFLQLANLHHRQGEHAKERAVLEEWLGYWPEGRYRGDRRREHIVDRIELGCH